MKPHDPFQAAVEQQRRRAPAARHRERQSESSRQLSAEYLRHGGPSAWDNSPNVHPYGQPGFGFYSGENLAAGRQRQREPKRSMSVDEDFRGIPHQFWSEPLAPDLPFSPYQGFSGPSFGGRGECDAGGTPRFDLDPWTGLALAASPYSGPEQELLYPDHVLSTRMPHLGGSMSSGGQWFLPRSIPPGLPTYRERPIFDNFRPFSDSPVPNPYIAPILNRNTPSDRPPPWNPLSGMRTPSRPVRPPGSYERLRPPHLQRGNS